MVALKLNLENYLENILPLHRSRPDKQDGVVNIKSLKLLTYDITYHTLSGSVGPQRGTVVRQIPSVHRLNLKPKICVFKTIFRNVCNAGGKSIVVSVLNGTLCQLHLVQFSYVAIHFGLSTLTISLSSLKPC